MTSPMSTIPTPTDPQYDRRAAMEAYNARHGGPSHRITSWLANADSETVYVGGAFDAHDFRRRIAELHLAHLRGFDGRKWTMAIDTTRSIAGAVAVLFQRNRVAGMGSGNGGLWRARVRNAVALGVRGAYVCAALAPVLCALVYSRLECMAVAFAD